MQRLATLAQAGEQRGLDEIIGDAEAARRELVDQLYQRARRRGRSPRRLLFGRTSFVGRRAGELRLAAVALRRLSFDEVRRRGAAFFGGHNIVPRHFGEPQRQA